MGGGTAVAWTNWAVGVLDGIKAPLSGTNFISLWNWSTKESGPDPMRWNNPLNTTQMGYGGVNMNSVGVKLYPSVADGINATVTTLLNGRYPTIVANLRGQLPHQQWTNAAAELGTWGTGADWLGWQLDPPIETQTWEDFMDQATFDALVAGNPFLQQYVQGLGFRVKALLDNAPAVDGGPTKGEPNQLRAELDAIKARLDSLGAPAGSKIQGTITATIS